LTALATELASLRERIGRSSRNSSKPPSSDGPGFKPLERRKGSGRKRVGQPGHPGSGPELLPIERVDEVVEHHPDACRRCGTLLQGEDPDPLRHQVIEIPPITPLVIEHRLHRLVCPCCSTSTCATLPADVEASPYGPRLSALVGLLGSAFPLSFSKTQALLNQLLGVEISRGAIATIRQRLSAALAQPMAGGFYYTFIIRLAGPVGKLVLFLEMVQVVRTSFVWRPSPTAGQPPEALPQIQRPRDPPADQ
ncbi:MAG: DUF6444 domain-containing protein, partial [Cyanobium sp.]